MKKKLGILVAIVASTAIMTSSFAAAREIVIYKSGFNICYKHVVKHLKGKRTIQHCNPYGVCREIIIPRHAKVSMYKGCHIQNDPCSPPYSSFGTFSNPHKAHAALERCRNYPIEVIR